MDQSRLHCSSIWKPEFSGYAFGHFSKRKKGPVVQIVVPQSVANGEGIKAFIGEAFREAVRLASHHMATKGIDFLHRRRRASFWQPRLRCQELVSIEFAHQEPADRRLPELPNLVKSRSIARPAA